MTGQTHSRTFIVFSAEVERYKFGDFSGIISYTGGDGNDLVLLGVPIPQEATLVISPDAMNVTLLQDEEVAVFYTVDASNGSILPTPAAMTTIDEVTGEDASWAFTTSAANQGVSYEVFFNSTGLAPGIYTGFLKAGPVEGYEDANIPIVLTVEAPNVLSIHSFTLVDADTNQDIMEPTEGSVIDVSSLPTENLNIRANATRDVGSVFLQLSGTQNKSQMENIAPFALFGDINGNYARGTFNPGEYTLSATPYSARNKGGTEGRTLSVMFEFSEDSDILSVNSFVLVDADTNQDIMEINDGEVIDISSLPTENLNIRANATPDAGSVFLQLSGTQNKSQMENIAPFALFGDINGNYARGTFNPGEYTLSATPYSARNKGGTEGRTLSVMFEFSEDSDILSVNSFVLVDADTNQDIMEINDGEVIDISSLPTENLNIRANATPDVGSVFLQLSGVLNKSRIESVVPYSLFGDTNGNYAGGAFDPGSYTLTATPYSAGGRGGTMGSTATINFEFGYALPFEVLPSNSFNLFPNPARVSTNARFDKPIKVMTFQIYDMNGRLIRIYEAREVKDGEEYSLDLTFLQPGMYFIRTIDENGMMLSKPIIIEY